jgi:DNA repair photolyase
MVDILPLAPQKGRAAVSNESGRFEDLSHHKIDDGWADDEDVDFPLPKLRTEITEETPKKIIAWNASPDVPFDRSINPYRGCEHGCIYCFARPSHAYHGLSSGLDFESKLFSKPDAAKLLDRELRKPSYVCQTLQLGANTDPYQPIERDLGITRSVLEVLAAFNHPVVITTKSDLVLRDLDILTPMAEKGLVVVGLSVTTLENKLSRVMEPRASTPKKRLSAIRKLSDAGVPVRVMLAPVIPALNDWEIERILEAGAGQGAMGANYLLLRLPHELKALFREWLNANMPLKTNHVLSLMKQSHKGTLYVPNFGERMSGSGKYAELIAKRYQLALKKTGLTDRTRDEYALDCSQFLPPLSKGAQLALF